MMPRHALDYAGVSGLCLLLHNLVMIAADSLGLMLPLAVLASYMIVVVSGYALHSRISFRREMSLATFLRYAVAMSVNIPLTMATTWLWLGPAGLQMHWAAPLATLCTLAINYLLSRWAISRPISAQGQ
jgi:putative flippase GtrA